MAEARRRLDTRLRTSLDLTVRDICEELAASLKDLEQASSRADRQRAREGEACCRLALAPADQHVAAEQARQQVADRINHRRGVKP